MPARFIQLWPNAGVDEQPAAMVVPRGGFNVIGLVDGAGLGLFPERKGLVIDELDATAIKTLALARPLGAMPAGTRLLRIASKERFGASGVEVRVRDPKTSADKSVASLRVVVVDTRTIKLAIRPLMVRNDKGAWVNHAQKPFDIAKLHAAMNAVWTPQSNIVFDLVSQEEARFDDEAGVAKALGMKAEKAPLPRQINFPALIQPLKALKPAGADFTMLLVDSIGVGAPYTAGDGVRYGSTNPNGQTISEAALALIADKGRDLGDGERVMPHEAGHWLGAFAGKQGWVRYGHPETDKNMLMSDGGSGVKVPVNRTTEHFNKNY